MKNNEEQIKAAFTNFIGLLIDNNNFENPKAIKHSIIACLLEEIDPICRNEDDNNYDLFIVKPIFRFIINILNNRINLLQQYNESEVKDKINIYKAIIQEFNSLLDSIKID